MASSRTDEVLTPRLRLAPVRASDADDLAALHADPIVARWTGPWTRTSIEAWAADMEDRWAREGVGKWVARARADGALVGRGGFTRFDLDGEPVLELGWAVRDRLAGRGYATEIGRAGIDWARTHEPGLPVVAFTEVHNRASRAVMEKLGMQHTGRIRREGLIEGRPGLHADAPFALYRLAPVAGSGQFPSVRTTGTEPQLERQAC